MARYCGFCNICGKVKDNLVDGMCPDCMDFLEDTDL